MKSEQSSQLPATHSQKVSIYQNPDHKPLTENEANDNATIICEVFKMNPIHAGLMARVFVEEQWTLQRVRHAVKYITKHHQYPTVMPANILSYDFGFDYSRHYSEEKPIAVKVFAKRHLKRGKRPNWDDVVERGKYRYVRMENYETELPFYVDEEGLEIGLKYNVLTRWSEYVDKQK
jgi:hypothetical protein